MSAIAASATSSYLASHPGLPNTSDVALDHGFQTALYVLVGLLIMGALLAATLLRAAPASVARLERAESEEVAFEKAA